MPKAQFSNTHLWVAAANVPIDDAAAEAALRLGYVKIKADMRIDVLDLHCIQCRRWYDDVRDQPCEVATIGNGHLRGGPPDGERRKRKCPDHNERWEDCEHLHVEPANYGRPPLTAAVVAAAVKG